MDRDNYMGDGMKHEFSQALRAIPERFSFAERAAKQLDEITATTRFPAKATWDIPNGMPSFNPKVQPAVRLVISDDGSHAVSGDVWPSVPVSAGVIWPDDRDSIHRLTFEVAQVWDAYLKSLQTALFENSLLNTNETSGVAAS